MAAQRSLSSLKVLSRLSFLCAQAGSAGNNRYSGVRLLERVAAETAPLDPPADAAALRELRRRVLADELEDS